MDPIDFFTRVNLSKIARPLTVLTKSARSKWCEDAQNTFGTLKQALLEAPVLAFPDITKPFKVQTIYTDASQYALGAVLMQEHESTDRVIQHISHQFSEQKQKWPTIEREASLEYAEARNMLGLSLKRRKMMMMMMVWVLGRLGDKGHLAYITSSDI